MMTTEALNARREYFKNLHANKSPEEKEALKQYQKTYRQKNHDKLKRYQDEYWNRKAEKLKINSNNL